jgi:hypothetical protein
MTSKQTSWIYCSLAWVTPRQAGWVFCGSALVTIFLIFLSIYGDNTNYTHSDLAMITLPFTLLAGLFAVISWYIDRYEKDDESRIETRYYLHISVFIYIIWMGITFARFALK